MSSLVSSVPPSPRVHLATVARFKVGPSMNTWCVDVHILSRLSVEFIIERPGKTERWCRGVRFRHFYISFILLSPSLLIISPIGNMALSNSFFPAPYLLALLSSWRRFRSWMQHAIRPHGLDFIFSTLYGGIRRRWCPSHLDACASPIVIFSLGGLKSSHS